MSINQRALAVRSVLSVSQTSTNTTGTYTDIAPSGTIGKREHKIIVVASGVSGTSPVFPIALTECDTTNGTFTAVSGLSISNVTTNGTTEYHAPIQKRYVIATVGTVTGTTPKADLNILVQTQLRSA